ncbi:MAG: GDP-L-fucose synthase [Candidatus Riflebacteria bacterium]|nr:GDP-L-fucose synthase [Candidatus Riflebacteria bacterium]
MEKNAKIYVAGHRGLAGSALCRALRGAGHENILTKNSVELDLRDGTATAAFFDRERPEYVFLAAAKVGGIHANNTYPATFIHDNLAIELNVVHQAWTHGVKRLVFLGSSCVYPRDCRQPIKEEYLLSGPLEKTNDAYAIAKIAGIKLCEAYHRQHGAKFFSVMPTNLYGPGDNYDLENSHVLPALIRKFHEGKRERKTAVEVWGSGSPRRDFLFSDDMAAACVFLMNMSDAMIFEQGNTLVNIGSGADHTIRELAELTARVIGYTGDLAWNSSKPDGTPKKCLDVTRLSALGWAPRVALEDGIRIAYDDFLKRYENYVKMN